MDTDSLYMAISGESLNEVVKEDREPQLQAAINNKEKCRLDVVYEPDSVSHFLPRICCERHKIYDQKTPGLFKLEFDGHVMISLCSKCMPPKTGRQARKSTVQKVSGYSACKIGARLPAGARAGTPRVLNDISLFSGLSKRAVKDSCQQECVSVVQLYKNVLYERESRGGVNHWFRVRANQVVTYQQERRALGYFYCKRKVLADGVSTAPLDITLRH